MNPENIKNIQHLSNYLRCGVDFLQTVVNQEFHIIDRGKERLEEITNPDDLILVDKMYLKKKGKTSGYRIVYSARTSLLSDSLKILNNNLGNLYTPKDSVHGFVKNRNIRTNAERHLEKKQILSVDIENYFESITQDQVIIALKSLGFIQEIAQWISCLVTINGRLVQGFSTSPTLANIISSPLDLDFENLCGDNVIYTRYADDLYFSTDQKLPSLEEIKEIIERYGFKLNDQKTKRMYRGGKQYVTGLTVFDRVTPRISKRIKRSLKLEIYFIKKYGFRNHALKRLIKKGNKIEKKQMDIAIKNEIDQIKKRITGWLNFINSIEPKVAERLYSMLRERNSK